ncbi:inter-alpha-trypsin inhibitor heavy chain H3-like isoform X1 [Mizuhopecten yessoensis]|nr:inter-alpha-trypsin inhibitor heavy chain H3-like isoform X1 [Mizuhopecten yessoensis]
MQTLWFIQACLAMAVAVVGAMILEPPVRSGTHPSDLSVKPTIYYLHIKSDIRFRFATTIVTSKIANRDVEAHQTTFKVTLPNEAFITNFTLTVGNNTFIGDVKRKEEARQEYETAVSQGRTAAHISLRPRETNMFNIDVNVAAEQKLTFELRYQELLQRKLGSYNQVIYVQPGEPVQDLRVDVDIFESRAITNLKVPPIRNDILTDVDITDTNEVAIIDHISDKRVHIRYQPSLEQQIAEGDSEGLDGQFRVTYDVARQNDGGDMLLVNGYFVHFFAPTGLEPRPKNAVFILDKSGSMSGTKIRQLRKAMRTILSQLEPADNFNIITFDSRITYWKNEQQLVPASEANINAAKHYVNDMPASGGTNIQEAMLTGISLVETHSNRGRSSVIIFLTDGEPTSGETSPTRILARVLERNEGRVPVFSLAFGQNADYSLVKRLASQNNGFGRKIYEDSDADLQISNFYSEVSTVLLQNVTFTYLDGTVEREPIRIICDLTPTLMFGSELVVTGRISEEETNELQPMITGIGANGLVTLHVPDTALTTQLNITQDSDAFGITEKLWAYLTIKQWIKQMEASTDENKQESWKENITAMALKYNFVTPLTSMVVTLPDELQVSPVQIEGDDMGLEEIVDVPQHRQSGILPALLVGKSQAGVYHPGGHIMRHSFSRMYTAHFLPPKAAYHHQSQTSAKHLAMSILRGSQNRMVNPIHLITIKPHLTYTNTVQQTTTPLTHQLTSTSAISQTTTTLASQPTSTSEISQTTTTLASQPTSTSAFSQTTTMLASQPTSKGTISQTTTMLAFQPTSTGTISQTTTMLASQPNSTGTISQTSPTPQPTTMSTIQRSTTSGTIHQTSTPTAEFTTKIPNSRQLMKMLRTRTKASDYTLLVVKGVDLPLCFRNPRIQSVDDSTMYNLARDPATAFSVSVGYTFHGSGRRQRTRITRISINASDTTTRMSPGFRVEGEVRQRAQPYSVFGGGENPKWEVVNQKYRLSLLVDYSRNTNRNLEGSLIIPIKGEVQEKQHPRRNRSKGKLILKALRGGVKQTIKTRVKFSRPMRCWVVKTQLMLNV